MMNEKERKQWWTKEKLPLPMLLLFEAQSCVLSWLVCVPLGSQHVSVHTQLHMAAAG